MNRHIFAERKSKYKNVKTDGYSSKKEAKRAAELRLMERAGAIKDLREQVEYVLAPSVVRKGRKRPPVRYFADFVYIENDKLVVEDVKGLKTPVYNLKAHLMKHIWGIDIRET